MWDKKLQTSVLTPAVTKPHRSPVGLGRHLPTGGAGRPTTLNDVLSGDLNPPYQRCSLHLTQVYKPWPPSACPPTAPTPMRQPPKAERQKPKKRAPMCPAPPKSASRPKQACNEDRQGLVTWTLGKPNVLVTNDTCCSWSLVMLASARLIAMDP